VIRLIQPMAPDIFAQHSTSSMHTHSAPNPVPAPRAVYWATQLLAWTLLIVLLGLYLFQSNLLSRDQVKVLVLFFFTGIGISHLFRWVIIRNRWLERDIGFVLPRLSLVALLLSVLAFLVLAVVHDVAFPSYAPMLQGGPLDLLLNIINWTVLLFVWSLGYFAYIYFIRSAAKRSATCAWEPRTGRTN
jgi:hypothetical protein